eukprot:COSAG02_NODE_40769_length_401_cov_1.668874_1_plen_26_part_10
MAKYELLKWLRETARRARCSVPTAGA